MKGEKQSKQSSQEKRPVVLAAVKRQKRGEGIWEP